MGRHFEVRAASMAKTAAVKQNYIPVMEKKY